MFSPRLIPAFDLAQPGAEPHGLAAQRLFLGFEMDQLRHQTGFAPALFIDARRQLLDPLKLRRSGLHQGVAAALIRLLRIQLCRKLIGKLKLGLCLFQLQLVLNGKARIGEPLALGSEPFQLPELRLKRPQPFGRRQKLRAVPIPFIARMCPGPAGRRFACLFRDIAHQLGARLIEYGPRPFASGDCSDLGFDRRDQDVFARAGQRRRRKGLALADPKHGESGFIDRASAARLDPEKVPEHLVGFAVFRDLAAVHHQRCAWAAVEAFSDRIGAALMAEVEGHDDRKARPVGDQRLDRLALRRVAFENAGPERAEQRGFSGFVGCRQDVDARPEAAHPRARAKAPNAFNGKAGDLHQPVPFGAARIRAP